MDQNKRIVQKNRLTCPTDRLQFAAIAILVWTAIITNGLIPCLPDVQYIMFVWLGITDLLMVVVLVAATLTITTEAAIPAVKQRFSSSEPIIVDVRWGCVYEGHCYRCAVDVPPRTKHCTSCHKCVEQFDHHCQILNACVGKPNHRSFVVTIVATLLYLFSSLFLCGTAVAIVLVHDVDMEVIKGAWISFLATTALMLLAPIVILARVLTWQIRSHVLGLSQYEWFVKRSMENAAREMQAAAEEDIPEIVVEKTKPKTDEKDIPEVVVEKTKPKTDEKDIPEVVVEKTKPKTDEKDIPEVVAEKSKSETDEKNISEVVADKSKPEIVEKDITEVVEMSVADIDEKDIPEIAVKKTNPEADETNEVAAENLDDVQ